MKDLQLDVRVVADLPWVWRHQCGALNDGAYRPGAFCGGCRFDTREDEIERFLLLTVDTD